MSTGAKVAVAVASGMLLGRSKKQKLAITVGGILLGRRLNTDDLLKQGQGVLDNNPELQRLSEQVRGTLLEAVRAAAIASASKRLDAVSDSLHERSERMRSASSAVESGEEEEPEVEADADESEQAQAEEPGEEEPDEGEAAEEEPDEGEAPEEEEPEQAKRPRKAASKKQTAKKSAPAKRTPAKKSTKKSAAKKQSASGR